MSTPPTTKQDVAPSSPPTQEVMTDANDAHDVSMTITAARGTPQDVFAVPTLRPQRELVVGDLLKPKMEAQRGDAGDTWKQMLCINHP